jgi:hypothetical protein
MVEAQVLAYSEPIDLVPPVYNYYLEDSVVSTILGKVYDAKDNQSFRSMILL